MAPDIIRNRFAQMDTKAKVKEIERNLAYFREQLPELIKHHRGRYALLKDRGIVGIYDTATDAQTTGETFFKDGLFSVQKIVSEPIDLGYFSHVGHLG